MSERRKQAEHALRVYLDRGSKALSSLARGEVDHANDWLNKRDAAFRNFLALEHAAKKEDNFDAVESGWHEMLEAASHQNTRLKRQLSDTISNSAGRSRALTESSRIISKFTSGNRKSGFNSAS